MKTPGEQDALPQQRIDALRQELERRDDEIARLQQELQALRQSTSWRLTAPLRWTVHQLRRIRHVAAIAPGLVRLGGGLRPTLARALRIYRQAGLAGVRQALVLAQARWQATPDIQANSADPDLYQQWIDRYDTLDVAARQRIRARIADLARRPRISVLMPVYDPPVKYLEAAIQSVREQLYPDWELCIADDASPNPAVRELLQRHAREDDRIRLVLRPDNGHISAASNSALALATGEFVALLDHDDRLPEHALFCVAQAILEHPDAGLFYSDEDKIREDGSRFHPYFKCELNPELLLAQNMICHLGVYRRELLEAVGGFRAGFEGAQDYDLALRVLERLRPEQVRHIPRVLYHWRAIAGSTALSGDEKNYAAEAGRRAVREHLQRRGLRAEVTPAPGAADFNRVRFALPEPAPLVSLIIPTRDHAALLQTCLDSVLERSSYPAYEILVIDNGSVEPETAALFARLPGDRVRVLRDDAPFNYSALNNRAAREARGELLCLMNNDIEVLTPDWLEEMVSFAAQPDIGCVGARLWYPDGRLQHGGVIHGLGGVAGHSHKYAPRDYVGYFHRAVLHQDFSAVTAACLVVRKAVYEQVGGLDESLAVAFNDVDFCMRVREAGYRNVWTPYAEMIHHESVTRGQEDNPEKQARFAGEIRRMQARWGDAILRDPAYSPNLSLDHEDFSLAWPPRVTPL